MLQKMFFFSLFLFGIGLPTLSLAYPNFIGHGYNTCVTCHYNSLGNGALNDYGRALFSSEIASRSLYPKSMDEEALASQSGFLGSKELPWWIRPGIKARSLWYQTDPGSAATISKYLVMQSDVNVAIHFDPKQKFMMLLSTGMTPNAQRIEGTLVPSTSSQISREYYFRCQINKNWLSYIGLMDKSYGLRTIDHTSYSRQTIGFGQNDQSHGVLIHYQMKDYEIAVHGLLGHFLLEENLRQKGISLTSEKTFAENFRLGASFLSTSNKTIQWQRAGVHGRLATGIASSVIGELGFSKNTNLTTSTSAEGLYSFIQSYLNFTRGYSLLSSVEYYNAQNNDSASDNWRWGLGLLAFPAPRFEFRFGFVNTRTISPSSGNPDHIQLQSQLHLSL